MDLVKLLAKLQTIGVTEDKKPDADKDGVPDWADKKPGADDSEDEKSKANEDIQNVLRKLSAIQEADQKIEEDDVEEGNEFSGALKAAKEAGKEDFEVGGKKYKVKEAAEEKCPECGKMHEGECKEEDLKECDMSPLSTMSGNGMPDHNETPDRYTLTIQRGDKNLNVTTDNPAELMQLMKLAGVIQGAEQVQQEPVEEVANEDWGNTPAATNEREPRAHGDIRDWGLPGTAKAKVRYTPQQQGDNPMAESKMFEEYKRFKAGK